MLHKNLTAYKDVEVMATYKTVQELHNYRALLLKKTEKQRDFIRTLFKDEKANLLEVCSGNSRLLYSLSLSGLLKHGVGIEISEARVSFANKWGSDLGITNVENICGDIMEYQPQEGFYDLAACITNAFMFFFPIDETYPQKLLNKLNSALRTDGKILLETKTYEYEVNMCKRGNNEFKTWVEFPKEDPYRYLLTRYIYHLENNCLDLCEVFIRRDGYVYDEKSEIAKIYSRYEIEQLLSDSGFHNIHIYSDWDLLRYTNSGDQIIAVAEKY